MGMFKWRWQSAVWSLSVNASTSNLQLVVPSIHLLSPNAEFPWANVRKHTDLYLRRKKRDGLTQDELDVKLLILMLRYPREDIAVAACGHALSSTALRNFLENDFNIEPDGSSGDLRCYLQAIIAASYVNNGSISTLDTDGAKIMIAAMGETTAGEQLRTLSKILVPGVPSSSLIYRHITVLGRKICLKFSAELARFQLECDWFRAHKAASWLSTVAETFVEGSLTDFGLEQLLRDNFPTWRAWAMWRPNVRRIQLWNELSSRNREFLLGLLSHEGPDFFFGQSKLAVGASAAQAFGFSQSTFWIGAHQFCLELHTSNEGSDMLDRLLDPVGVYITAGRDDLALLQYFITQPITHERLYLLEIVHEMANPLVSLAVLKIYEVDDDSIVSKWALIEESVQILLEDTTQGLRRIIIPHIATLATSAIGKLQGRLQAQLDDQLPWITQAIDLHTFGRQLMHPWLMPWFSLEIRSLLEEKYSSITAGSFRALYDIWSLAETTKIPDCIRPKISMFCRVTLIRQDFADKLDILIVSKLASAWIKPTTDDVCIVAMRVADVDWICDKLHKLQIQLLDDLLLRPMRFVVKLREILECADDEPSNSECLSLWTLLKSAPFDRKSVTYFRHCLYIMIGQCQQRLMDCGTSNMKVKGWIQLVKDLQSISDKIKLCQSPCKKRCIPTILERSLLARAEYLSDYLTFLEILENDLSDSPLALQCLLFGGIGNETITELVKKTLRTLTEHYESTFRKAMLATLKRLTHNGNNIEAVYSMLNCILASSEKSIQILNSVLELYEKDGTKHTAIVTMTCMLNNKYSTRSDIDLLRNIIEFLGLYLEGATSRNLSMEIDYIEAQYAELLAEVQRLEEQRAVLYLHDPNTISEMLENLGIKCPSPLDVELAKLPQALVGMVERIGLQDVELQIPLTNFRALQQIAMGLGSSHSLILRLTFDDSMKLLGFCLHLEELSTENNLNTHHPWDVSEGNLPNGPFCHSSGNRTIYHLARILTRYLRGGFKSLENIYEVATSALKELTHSCLVCGAFHRAKLRRSAVCDLQECSRLFLRASLEIRVAEILYDAQVVDLLLTSIFHAASTRNMLLLPGCPFPNTLTIYQLLSKMPPISTLTQAPDLIPAIKNLGPETEKLLSWACLSYRGFLASATGIMRIPGMPAGTQQFLLASAAPLLETGFAEESNIPGGKIRLVWHGTHLTRLFAILSQGLQIKSGTALQTHGAVHGNGIYVAEEPATSWAYCDKISPVGWPGSELNGCAVLLGVELVCFNEKSGVKVWLVDSPTAVIVRYVFLVPVEAARMPRKADVLPAMVSALHALRVGSV